MNIANDVTELIGEDQVPELSVGRPATPSNIYLRTLQHRKSCAAPRATLKVAKGLVAHTCLHNLRCL